MCISSLSPSLPSSLPPSSLALFDIFKSVESRTHRLLPNLPPSLPPTHPPKIVWKQREELPRRGRGREGGRGGGRGGICPASSSAYGRAGRLADGHWGGEERGREEGRGGQQQAPHTAAEGRPAQARRVRAAAAAAAGGHAKACPSSLPPSLRLWAWSLYPYLRHALPPSRLRPLHLIPPLLLRSSRAAVVWLFLWP